MTLLLMPSRVSRDTKPASHCRPYSKKDMNARSHVWTDWNRPPEVKEKIVAGLREALIEKADILRWVFSPDSDVDWLIR